MAEPEDVGTLVALMTEFYQESGYPLDGEGAAAAFRALIGADSWGRIWLIQGEREPMGYVVLTLGFSMEYGGRDAFLDDLFVRRHHRGRGLGREAIAVVRAECEARGVRALHLEVDRSNQAASRLYRKAGFVDNDRQLLTLRLGTGLHDR